MIPPLFCVGFHDNGFHDAHISMSVKVKVPNEWMKLALIDAYNETNDTNGVRIGYSRGELDSSNNITSFFVFAQRTLLKS